MPGSQHIAGAQNTLEGSPMGQMITKPDANPILFAVLNAFLFGAAGYFVMGQKKKAMITAAICFVVPVVTCGIASPLVMFAWVTAYDAYLLGQKLERGEAIGENENGLDFLNAIFKD